MVRRWKSYLLGCNFTLDEYLFGGGRKLVFSKQLALFDLSSNKAPTRIDFRHFLGNLLGFGR